jgi:hypothetical protein
MVSIPFFMRGVPYDIDVDYPTSHVNARPGDIVNFFLVMDMDGGNYNRIINIQIIRSEGDWEVIPDDRSIILAPDSRREVIFRCTIPMNATEGEEYSLEYEFQSVIDTHSDDLEVTVDSFGSIFPPVIRGGGGVGMRGTDPGLTYFVFIPEVIVVVCVIMIFIIARKDKRSADIKEN